MGVGAGPKRWRFRSKRKDALLSKTFGTKKEATEYQALVSEQLHEAGVQQTEVVLNLKNQRCIQAALDTGISVEDLKDAAKLLLSSTRGAQGKDRTLGEAVEAAKGTDCYLSRRPSTQRGYKSKWDRFVRVMGPERKLYQIGPQEIRDYLQDIRNKISVNEAYSTHSDLRSLYRTYFRKHLGFMEETPFHNDKVPAPEGRVINSKIAYKEWEFKLILLEALEEGAKIQQLPRHSHKELSYVPILLIQALTGMRPGEAGLLTYGMFGEEGFIRHIDRSNKEDDGDENLIILPRSITKEKNVRQVILFDELKESLFWWPHFLKHFDISKEGCRVKPQYKDKRVLEYNHEDFSRRLKAWCKRANVKYKQNSLRHTFISHAIRGKFDSHIDELKFMVGHAKDTETTIKSYMRLTPKREAKAYFWDYSRLYQHKPHLEAIRKGIRKKAWERLLIPRRDPRKREAVPNIIEVDFTEAEKLRQYTERCARIEQSYDA